MILFPFLKLSSSFAVLHLSCSGSRLSVCVCGGGGYREMLLPS